MASKEDPESWQVAEDEAQTITLVKEDAAALNWQPFGLGMRVCLSMCLVSLCGCCLRDDVVTDVTAGTEGG